LFALALAVSSAVGGACGGADDPRDLSVVRVALTQVPAGVRCVRFTITVGGSTIVRPFAVTAGSMPTLSMTALPSGMASFLPEAFDVACGSITATTLPTWVAPPLATTLMPGEIVNLAFALRPGAGASATLDFVSISMSPATQDFGVVQPGQMGGPVAFTVRNIGAAATGALTVALGGVDASQFTSTTDCTTLAIGAACTVQIRFAPTTPGSKSATLGVSGSPGGAVTSTLTGSASTPAALALAPSMADLGAVSVGSSGVPMPFTVTNPGGSPSGPLISTLTGTDAAQFVLMPGTCGVALAPGANCSLTVSFRPTVAGPRSATLVVSGMPGGSVSAALIGAGVTPAALAISPAAMDFGTILLGGAPSDRMFAVTNTGGALASMLMTGASGPGFTLLMNGCTAPLPPMATCSVVVRFAPTMGGAHNGSLVVSGPGVMAAASLTGTGASPAGLAISPASHDFEVVTVGSVSPQIAPTVTNIGATPTPPLMTTLSGMNPMDFLVLSDTCAGVALPPMASCQVVVRFRPTAPGPRNALLTATTGMTSVSAMLRGEGM
jgi:hypothetical protein